MEVATSYVKSQGKSMDSGEAARCANSLGIVCKGRYIWFGTLVVVATLADLVSKELVFSWRGSPSELPPYWIIEPYVGIETAVNHGALFGMGQGKGWLFAGFSVVAAVAIVVWLFVYKAASSMWLTITMGLVMGGIFGNLYDRLGIPNLPADYRGGVRDWVLLTYQGHVWPNFNIADSFLVTGAIMLAAHSLFMQKNESAVPKNESQEITRPMMPG